ncbi:MAG: bifunctional (p)ppGpp synthetase/guanosine-3',5'-bis(diphosphate) 3'-pyrophosphohydrolase, partial [Bacteroidales bacterium]|nr:bifunctional (p)ppGpp synthetase/guanosine-3',5'-bis(diphosphate) 3'-pyrophosphohydrolase [Bacteroidales bacterium]
MANAPLNTELLDRAILFAVKAHAGTERRGKGFPYIVHPLEAVEIVATITPDQELLAAAALHDTVEDTDVTVEQLRAEFGPRIAALVADESDVFTEGVSEEDS